MYEGKELEERTATPAASVDRTSLLNIEDLLVQAHRKGWTYRRTSKAILAAQPAADPEAVRLLREVAAAGVVITIPGKYVEVQIDEDTWDEVQALAAAGSELDIDQLQQDGAQE